MQRLRARRRNNQTRVYLVQVNDDARRYLMSRRLIDPQQCSTPEAVSRALELALTEWANWVSQQPG